MSVSRLIAVIVAAAIASSAAYRETLADDADVIRAIGNLKDGDSLVRIRAATKLGESASATIDFVKPLKRALHDKHRIVRYCAAQSLAKVSYWTGSRLEIIDVLSKAAFEERDSLVGRKIWHELRRIGGKGGLSFRSMLPLRLRIVDVRDPSFLLETSRAPIEKPVTDDDIRAIAKRLDTIERLGLRSSTPEVILGRLGKSVNDKYPKVRMAAATRLRQFDAEAEHQIWRRRVQQILYDAGFTEENADVRRHILNELNELSPALAIRIQRHFTMARIRRSWAANISNDVLLATIKNHLPVSRIPLIRESAFWELAHRYSPHKFAKVIIPLAVDSPPVIRDFVLNQMWGMDEDADVAYSLAFALRYGLCETHIIELIEQIEPDFIFSRELLAYVYPHAKPAIRRSLLVALGTMNNQGPATFLLLAKSVVDGGRQTSQAALVVLHQSELLVPSRNWRHPDWVTVLKSSQQPIVARTAAALAKSMWTGRFSVPVFRMLRRDSDELNRLRILRLLVAVSRSQPFIRRTVSFALRFEKSQFVRIETMELAETHGVDLNDKHDIVRELLAGEGSSSGRLRIVKLMIRQVEDVETRTQWVAVENRLRMRLLFDELRALIASEKSLIITTKRRQKQQLLDTLR